MLNVNNKQIKDNDNVGTYPVGSYIKCMELS